MSDELYKKYRPTKFSEVIGQDDATASLKAMGKSGKIPQCLLFVGPSGCGKTTIARILRVKLNCTDTDFSEMNCAKDSRGIESIRDISSKMSLAPLGGGTTRVYLMDECQKLTSDAQSALLKMLEDTPQGVYFMLCTTDAGKLIAPIKTRATVISVRLLKAKEMGILLTDIAAKENFKLTEDVRDKIIDVAQGSARAGLVLLNSVIGLTNEEEQLNTIVSSSASSSGFEICKLLLKNCRWVDISKLLVDMEDEPETVRRIILGYMTKVLLSASENSYRAWEIIDICRDPWYDSGKTMMAACLYECCPKLKIKDED